MRCPNRRCRRQTERQVCWADKAGKLHWGCANCIWTFRPESKNSNVRTNRKIWPAHEVYSKGKIKQMNHDWITRRQESAARQRREVGCISEGALNFLEQHSARGMIRPRVDGRPVR